MHKLIRSVPTLCALAVVCVLLTTACGATASPAATGAAKASAASAPTFQADWDKLIAAAKQEGTLALALGPNPPVEQQVLPLFQTKFGVQIEALHGSSDQLATKFLQEKAAGVHSTDIFIGSCSSGPPSLNGGLLAP